MSSHWNGCPLPEGARHCLAMPAGPMRRTTAARQTPQLTRSQMMRLGCVFPAVATSKRPPGRPNSVSPERIEKAREVLASGGTYKAAAQAAKCGASTVYRIINEKRAEREAA